VDVIPKDSVIAREVQIRFETVAILWTDMKPGSALRFGKGRGAV
jgi:hypothetical protein